MIKGIVTNAFLLLLLSGCGGSSVEKLNVHFSNNAKLVVLKGPVHDFGIKPVGSVTKQALSIQNQGVVFASSISGAFFSTAFTFIGGNYPGFGGTCENIINVGDTCELQIQFSPTYTGAVQESVNISYFDGANFTTTLNGASTDTMLLKGQGVNE